MIYGADTDRAECNGHPNHRGGDVWNCGLCGKPIDAAESLREIRLTGACSTPEIWHIHPACQADADLARELHARGWRLRGSIGSGDWRVSKAFRSDGNKRRIVNVRASSLALAKRRLEQRKAGA